MSSSTVADATGSAAGPPGGNFAGPADDYLSMDCDRCRAAISAKLDGEDPGLPDATLESHLAECAGCRDFAAGSARVHWMIRVTPAQPVPEMFWPYR